MKQASPNAGWKQAVLPALRAAFPHTVPVLAGYVFLGLTYGIYMRLSGFSFVYPMLMSITVFGGSLEFVMVTLLLSPFAPVQAFLMALLIQARHLFYGIAMLDRYRTLGKKKYYLIYGLSDETFSVAYTARQPEGVDRGWFLFFITLLDQLYWVVSATAGGLLGSLVTLNTKGMDFVMTAMFAVIFMNQWKKDTCHHPAMIGLGCSVMCLWLFGADSFLVPAMVSILALLTILKKPIEREAQSNDRG